MNKTGISWCDYTWNPVTGCTPISEGCAHCYAKRLAKTRLRGRCGYPDTNPFQVTLHPERLGEPLALRKPSRIFPVSMGDLFHPDVPDDFVGLCFAVMGWASHHRFYVLTKRSDRMYAYVKAITDSLDVKADQCRWYQLCESFGYIPGWDWDPFEDQPDWPYSNIWLGTTIELPDYLRRAEYLVELAHMEWHTFVSIEPMLSPVNLSQYLARDGRPGVQWVICGGERAGLDSRLMRLEWAQALLNQCRSAGVPFHFKHEGDWWWRHRDDLPVPEVVVDVREWPR